jgi:hypothetical protein
VNFVHAAGYWLMRQGRANPDGSSVDFLQCLYMTVISTFTVGYGEVIPIVTPAAVRSLARYSRISPLRRKLNSLFRIWFQTTCLARVARVPSSGLTTLP